MCPARAAAIVGFAASAGGLKPLTEVLHELPETLDAAIVVAYHAGPMSFLPDLLAARCRVRIKFAEDGEAVLSGTVYVAPPQRHLVVNSDRTLSVVDRARVRFVRPSADWLFESVAASYGAMSMAVVLSGYRQDGARGAVSVNRAGGRVFAQDPKTCQVPEMPSAAIRTGAVASVLTPAMIAREIVDRVNRLDRELGRREFDRPFEFLSTTN